MTTNTTGTTELIDTGERRDTLGRVVVPKERRQELVSGWRTSGLTQAAFAKREGVRCPTFAHWAQQATKKAIGWTLANLHPLRETRGHVSGLRPARSCARLAHSAGLKPRPSTDTCPVNNQKDAVLLFRLLTGHNTRQALKRISCCNTVKDATAPKII